MSDHRQADHSNEHDGSVSAKQIESVCQQFATAWQEESAASIADSVQGWQEPQRSQLIRKLVQIDIQRRRTRGLPCNVEFYRGLLPDDHVWLQDLISDDLTRSIRTGTEETRAGKSDSATEIDFAAGDPSPRTFADYVLLDELGRGGMGVVYRAKQLSLNRLVAIKMIAAGEFAGPGDIQRFRAEAEAAGRLDHPGIVPVYEFGESKGRHYFSMALVEGKSLRDRVQRDGPLPPESAGRLMKNLADAITYAHAQEIIHRDLKPSNVLMANDDTPRISDFGLAKQLAALSGTTHSGQILGTPSYMSPEQARGDSQIDQRADVYGLGSILYFVLTGRPPFQAASVAQTLRHVCEVEPVAPRSLNPGIPRDLETITLKCLQKDPGRRYDSAQELSADLVRFLTGQPIQARPVSRTERAIMWMRRRPGVASLLGLLFVALIAGTAVSTYFAVERQLALNEVRSEYDRAEVALTELRASIDKFVDTVETEELLREARFKPVLKRLLAQALEQYERYIQDHTDAQDAETRAELSRALMRVGQIHSLSGNMDDALRSFEGAIELQSELVRQNPTDNEVRAGLATTHLRISSAYRYTGNFAGALKSANQSVDLNEALVKSDPEKDAHAYNLALSLSELGTLLVQNGDSEKALETLERCARTSETLVEKAPDNADYLSILAISVGHLGVYYNEIGEQDKALEFVKRALALREQLVEDHADVDRYRFELATGYQNFGNFLRQNGAADDALEAYRKSLQLQEELVKNNPTVTKYQSEAALAHNAIGVIQKNTGNFAESITEYNAALEITERLASDNPAIVDYQLFLSGINNNLGNLYKRTNKPDQALAVFENAMTIQEQLVKDNPEFPGWGINLAGIHLNLAIIHREHKDPDAALAKLDDALKVLAVAREKLPNNPSVLLMIKNSHLERSWSLELKQDWEGALREQEAALELDDGRDKDMIHADWTQNLAKAGMYADAIREVEVDMTSADIGGEEQNLNIAYKAAGSFALASAAVAKDTEESEDNRAALQEQYAAKAMEILRQLSAAEHFDDEDRLRRFKDDDDFASLQERPDYQELLSDLDARQSASDDGN